MKLEPQATKKDEAPIPSLIMTDRPYVSAVQFLRELKEEEAKLDKIRSESYSHCPTAKALVESVLGVCND